eukprot:TRINITY_DN400_c1_g1_i1.p1 TRINITY_DN400_c1_g1~~TRINITY_DN400_c1_g1_i1.p1  ORF type:complete len:454 (-),score=44.97 TRINITY_DN400_c1_g1_i1:21-1382(-)
MYMERPRSLLVVRYCCWAVLWIVAAIVLCVPESLAAQPRPNFVDPRIVNRLAFGSCNHETATDKQHIWTTIAAWKPDVWVWLGDVVYADTKVFTVVWHPSPTRVMHDKYALQKKNPHYHAFLHSQTNTSVIGTWDDHDFGKNNGGSEYVDRKASQQLFLEFLDEPRDSPRWKQSGVYGSYTYGPPGKQLKIILLDVRYNRDLPHASEPGASVDMLGQEQWQWLEEQVEDARKHSNMLLVGSGIQVLPSDKPFQEKWSTWPESRKRLMALLRSTRIPTFILSGDVHYAEILKDHPSCDEAKVTEGVLYEATSSGLTHSCGSSLPLGLCNFLLNLFVSRWHTSDFYEYENWGSLVIHWANTSVSLHIHAADGTVAIRHLMRFDDLINGESKCVETSDIAAWKLWHFDWWIHVILVAGGVLAVVLVIAASALCYRIIRRRRREQPKNNKKKTKKHD